MGMLSSQMKAALFLGTTMLTSRALSFQQARQQHPLDPPQSVSPHFNEKQRSRRELLWETASLASIGQMLVANPSVASSQARVSEWPGLEFLEPVYELKLSVDALNKASSDTTKYPFLKQRMEQFFKGGIFSERNYYAGLGVQYQGKIVYEKNELNEYIKLDKAARFNSMENTLESLKELLEELRKDQPSPEEVIQSASQAKMSLDQWFALVPPMDVERARQIFTAANKADVNHNGQVEDNELETMSEEDRVVWKRRIDYVGG